MKKAKKIKLLLICLFNLLLIGNIFSGCESEKDFTKAIEKNKLIVKHCSMKDVSLQSNLKLHKAIDKLKGLQTHLLESQLNASSKMVYDENSGLLYDDEKGIYVSKDGKESYNFPVIQADSNEKIENITFNKNNQNEYDVYLVKYDYTKEDLQIFSREELAQRDQEYFPLIKEGIVYNEYARWMICIEIRVLKMVPINEGNLTGDFGYEAVWVTTSTQCESGGEVGPSTGGGGSGGSGSGSSGGGGGGGGAGGGSTGVSTGTGGGSSSQNAGSDSILSAAVTDDTPTKFPCLTPAKLLEIFPNASLTTRTKLAIAIQTYASQFGIDNKLKLCHFLAQVGVESGGLAATVEGLNYTTVEGLKANFWDFKSNNPNAVDPTPYLNNPEGLANFVYCCNKNGNGNGDATSGDGWTYRGRGYIQLTGKYNYGKYYDYLTSIGQSNLYQNPEDVANDPNRVLSAMWFFKKNVLNKIDINESTTADQVTKRVNYYTNKQSKSSRRNYFEKAKNKINC